MNKKELSDLETKIYENLQKRYCFDFNYDYSVDIRALCYGDSNKYYIPNDEEHTIYIIDNNQDKRYIKTDSQMFSLPNVTLKFSNYNCDIDNIMNTIYELIDKLSLKIEN